MRWPRLRRRPAPPVQVQADLLEETQIQLGYGRDAVVCTHPRACAGYQDLNKALSDKLARMLAALLTTGQFTRADVDADPVGCIIRLKAKAVYEASRAAQLANENRTLARIHAVPVDAGRLRDALLRYEDDLERLRHAREDCERDHLRGVRRG